MKLMKSQLSIVQVGAGLWSEWIFMRHIDESRLTSPTAIKQDFDWNIEETKSGIYQMDFTIGTILRLLIGSLVWQIQKEYTSVDGKTSRLTNDYHNMDYSIDIM